MKTLEHSPSIVNPQVDKILFRLSRQERGVLVSLYERYCLEREWERTTPGALQGEVDTWGVHWRVSGLPSVRASLSRTLARLECRGLVLRQNQVTGCPDTSMARRNPSEAHRRTTHVSFLPAGIQAGKRLTKVADDFC